MQIPLSELAALVGGQFFHGDPDLMITGVGSVSDAGPGDLTFFGNARYLGALKKTAASAALVPEDFADEITAVAVKVKNPSLAFATIAGRFAPSPIAFNDGIHGSAVIADSAVLGANVSVGPNTVIEPGARIGTGTIVCAGCYVGHDVQIGEACFLQPNVVIRERCVLGNRVIIQPGAIIGSDGFGYEFSNGKHQKIPQTGFVQIDDDVEIGANVTIDRARFGRTWIQEGTKIDNLVQIAHNVIIGAHSIVVAQVGISGSTHLGKLVTLAGQVGVAGHLEIGDGAIVAAQSGVTKDIPPGPTVWFGTPARPARETREQLAHLSRIGKLVERVRALERDIEALKESGSDSMEDADHHET